MASEIPQVRAFGSREFRLRKALFDWCSCAALGRPSAGVWNVTSAKDGFLSRAKMTIMNISMYRMTVVGRNNTTTVSSRIIGL